MTQNATALSLSYCSNEGSCHHSNCLRNIISPESNRKCFHDVNEEVLLALCMLGAEQTHRELLAQGQDAIQFYQILVVPVLPLSDMTQHHLYPLYACKQLYMSVQSGHILKLLNFPAQQH